jgi:hypothetical protein
MKKLELNQMEPIMGGLAHPGNTVDCTLALGGLMLGVVTSCIFPPAGALAISLFGLGSAVGVAGMVRSCGY